MKDKIKVIHIEHCSHSYFVSDKNIELDDVVKGSWAPQVASQIKKFYPNLEIECWFPEKLEKKQREFNFSGFKIKIFPTTFSPRYALDFSWPMIKALKKEIKNCEENKIKLIFHIHEIHNLHGLVLLRLLKNKNVIVQHHGGSSPLKHLKQSKKYRKFFLFFLLAHFLEGIVLKNAKVYFALTQDEINYLKKKSPKSRIYFNTMGITDDYYKKVPKNYARKKFNLLLNKKIVIYIGRINEEKGIRYLLDAMKILKDVELKILGFTQQIDYFKEYAKKNNLKNVEFLGGVFGEKKMLYLSAADALILPSSKEGAPVTIMEALARNTPVIVTNVGGIPLMVKNGQEGIIIKQKSSKDIVKSVREILRWKKKNVQKYAERYRWKKIIENTIKNYERL